MIDAVYSLLCRDTRTGSPLVSSLTPVKAKEPDPSRPAQGWPLRHYRGRAYGNQSPGALRD
jgi:hypothetical protein